MSYYKYGVDDLVRDLRDTRISKEKKLYDKKYFPKAKDIRIYTNSADMRPVWVKNPKESPKCTFHLSRIYSRNGRNKEYQQVVTPIKDSFEEYNINIDSVYKVVNRYLERQFELKKKEKDQLYHKCQEMTMYHATSPENVDDICTHNFNWRFSGSSRGHKYGFGVSFTPDPEFADQFCRSRKQKAVFVSKVLVASSHIGSPDIELPLDGYDTTRSPKKTVYVKFEDSEFYPQYLVYYS